MIDLTKRRRHKLTSTIITLAARLTYAGIAKGRTYKHENWVLTYYAGAKHWEITNSETNFVQIIPNAKLATSLWLGYVWGPDWMNL